MTRGHSSNIGESTAVGLETEKVVDSGTRSKLCKSCEYWEEKKSNSDRFRCWKAQHAGKCKISHEGSSGSMEGEIAKEMFRKSVEQFSLR